MHVSLITCILPHLPHIHIHAVATDSHAAEWEYQGEKRRRQGVHSSQNSFCLFQTQLRVSTIEFPAVGEAASPQDLCCDAEYSHSDITDVVIL